MPGREFARVETYDGETILIINGLPFLPARMVNPSDRIQYYAKFLNVEFKRSVDDAVRKEHGLYLDALKKAEEESSAKAYDKGLADGLQRVNKAVKDALERCAVMVNEAPCICGTGPWFENKHDADCPKKIASEIRREAGVGCE